MIIYENRGFETHSEYPDSDWTDKARFVVPDGSETARKIRTWYPYYDFMLDDDGNLIDVIELPRPPEPEPEPTADELMNLLLGGSYDE